jgi:diacylglycerol kinase family enzyme
MRFIAVLNKNSGTLRTIDPGEFSGRFADILRKAGHQIDFEVVSGAELDDALRRAAAAEAEVVIVGGGDGTVSSAAAALMGKEQALAILPAGTMNLFARGLGIPLSLDAAMEAFAHGQLRAVDMASANGRPFIHQFSIGMHAEMVGMRDSMEFASRLGKIRASIQAAFATLLNPPSLKIALKIGDAEILTRTTAISITNNLFGEGHLPYADRPDGGVLGIYVTVARGKGQLARLLLNIARGRWRDNPHIEIHESESAILKLLSRRGKRLCVMDGELLPLARETTFEIHKKVLNVLVPS